MLQRPGTGFVLRSSGVLADIPDPAGGGGQESRDDPQGCHAGLEVPFSTVLPASLEAMKPSDCALTLPPSLPPSSLLCISVLGRELDL